MDFVDSIVTIATIDSIVILNFYKNNFDASALE